MATVHVRFDRCLYAVASLFLIGVGLQKFVLFPASLNKFQLDIETEKENGANLGSSTTKDARKSDIKCETIVSQPKTEQTSYQHKPGMDSIGGITPDLFPVRTSNVEVLKKICGALDNCRGFNLNGWLKKGIGQLYQAGTDLYIKDVSEAHQETYLSAKIIEENYGKDYIRMTKQLKIYIYNVKAGEDIKSPHDYKYAVEKLFIDLLKDSIYVTKDPEEATFFFLPMRCTAYRFQVGDRWRAQTFAEQMAKEMLDEIKSSHPYWQRSLGADHFYICAHDMGVSVASSSHPHLLKNAIALVNTADYGDAQYIPHKDIALPPHAAIGPGSFPVLGKGGHGIDPKGRTTLAFFAGALDNGRIRPSLKQRWSKDADFILHVGHMPQHKYVHHLKTSKFCLCPRGFRAWSPRLMDAVWFGCVPVILSDHYDLPLQGLLNWTRFSVIVPESKIYNLKQILLSVQPDQLAKMQATLRQIFAHLTWNNPPRPYDAFHSVLFQLWQRRHVIRYKKADL